MNAQSLGTSRCGIPIIAHEQGSVGGLLLFGAIHGDEPRSAHLCDAFLQQPLDTAVALAVIPILNPDGLLRGKKDNAAGVDLNRNFPATSWRLEATPGYDPGPRPLSEPESQLLVDVVLRRKPRVIVAVHQPFACVNWDGPAEAVAQAMSARTGLPLRPSIGYPTPGSFGAYAGLDLGIAVITLELSAAAPADELLRAVSAVAAAWALSA